MARHLTATMGGGMGTFLLEVALDRANTKARLARALLQERTRRGGGDARRFPQPKMAEVLGYSLRQYQRLEDPEDPNLPKWSDLDRIMEILELDSDAIFGEAPEEVPEVSRRDPPQDRLEELAEAVDEVLEGQRLIRAMLEELTAPPVRKRSSRAAAPRRSR